MCRDDWVDAFYGHHDHVHRCFRHKIEDCFRLRGQTLARSELGYAGHIRNFLTLWKEADPDIPILKQAKAE